jgi:hypothetical protein
MVNPASAETGLESLTRQTRPLPGRPLFSTPQDRRPRGKTWKAAGLFRSDR